MITDIRFILEAEQDLIDIRDYYNRKAPVSGAKVLEDIYLTLRLLKMWPLAGHAVENQPGRRIVTPKYRFTITYDVSGTCLDIMGIYRYQIR